MRLKNISILIIVLSVILIALLVVINPLNVDDQANSSSSNLDNLANSSNDLTNLGNNPDTNLNNSDSNLDNNSNSNLDNNLNKPNNKLDSTSNNNLNKPDNKPNNKVDNKADNKSGNKLNDNLNTLNNLNNNQNNADKSTKTDINTNKLNSIILGSNSMGSVELIGPIGNKSSNVKIAYIIGVHPLEFNVHNTLYTALIAKANSLNYCYYIYKVNVTNNPNNYDTGRMNGQLLANKFVVPDAVSKNYDLVVDIHSNQGTKGGNYKETNFIFAPLNNATSKVFADEIIAKIPPLVYYYPESQTSPNYVTIPIMKSNTPTLIYETYMYESIGITKDYINRLITTIDNLKIK